MQGPSSAFEDTVMVGEFVTLQIVLFAARGNATNVQAVLSDLTGPSGAPAIPASAITVFNLGGISDEGQPFATSLDVPQVGS